MKHTKKVKMGYMPGDIHPSKRNYSQKSWKEIRKSKGKAQEKKRFLTEIEENIQP